MKRPVVKYITNDVQRHSMELTYKGIGTVCTTVNDWLKCAFLIAINLF